MYIVKNSGTWVWMRRKFCILKAFVSYDSRGHRLMGFKDNCGCNKIILRSKVQEVMVFKGYEIFSSFS